MQVLVKVTDGAGQTQGRAVPLTVTAEPLRIEAIPEAGALVQGVANNVFVLVTAVDGSPVAKARLDISGQDQRAGDQRPGLRGVRMHADPAQRRLHDQGDH